MCRTPKLTGFVSTFMVSTYMIIALAFATLGAAR